MIKIFRFIASGENPLTTDFTIYGLEKESPSYDRGRKFLSKYLDPIEQDLIVSKTFRDVRNNNGRLKSLEVDFDFYAEDGSIGLSKTEIVKKYNPFEAETEERKRRERQMDYLRASAKDTPIESHIEILLAHYQAEITLYKEGGSLALNQAMTNEVDANILAILNIAMPRNDGQGMTNVIKSIQYQIGAISLEDLNV